MLFVKAFNVVTFLRIVKALHRFCNNNCKSKKVYLLIIATSVISMKKLLLLYSINIEKIKDISTNLVFISINKLLKVVLVDMKLRLCK